MNLLAKVLKTGLLPIIMAVSVLLPGGALAVPQDDPLPLEGYVIGIDPGHQLVADNGYESTSPLDETKLKVRMSAGCEGVTTDIPEHEINLLVSFKLASLLEDSGAQVVMTRTSHDVSISNMERAEMMNSSGADFWLRIHCNSSRSLNTEGVMLLAPDIDSSVHDESSELADCVLQAFLEATGAESRSVIFTSTQTGFNYSLIPVVTVEMGYLSNPDEELLLCRDSYQSLCALGIHNGIVDYCEGITE